MRGAPVRWPDGRRFAFSIFDDTDGMTLRNGPPVYDLLTDLGLRITKSVWPLGPERGPTVGGSSCDDEEYLAWVLRLQAAGHEVGYHHASDHSSPRARTIAALDAFRDLFGHDPRVGADHAGNRESLGAGADRLTGLRAAAYRAVQHRLQPHRPEFSGAVPDSPWFWGDVCRERITYWRGLTFARTDLTQVCPRQPYHDPTRPYVNYWFVSADAPDLSHLLDRLSGPRLDRLERHGGVCILYTHLGLDIAPEGRVDDRFRRVMEDLARRPGWFAPVSDVLDHLRASSPDRLIAGRERAVLESRWILDRVRAGSRLGPRVVTHEVDLP